MRERVDLNHRLRVLCLTTLLLGCTALYRPEVQLTHVDNEGIEPSVTLEVSPGPAQPMMSLDSGKAGTATRQFLPRESYTNTYLHVGASSVIFAAMNARRAFVTAVVRARGPDGVEVVLQLLNPRRKSLLRGQQFVDQESHKRIGDCHTSYTTLRVHLMARRCFRQHHQLC